MIETISMTREGALFRIGIDMPMEAEKAIVISNIVEQDAGDAVVSVSKKKRLRRLKADGLVAPSTMRRILIVLAR